MNIVLWILQVLLAAVFFAHGWMFLAPSPELLVLMNEQLGAPFRIFLGVAEIAGAAGLILPALSRVRPGLTPLAAACLAFIVLSATILHVARAEYGPAVMTAILCLVGSFVAYGRWRLQPVEPRQGGRSHPRTPAMPA